MLKKVFLRALLGIPIGVFISYTITIFISILVDQGEYYPVVPDLTRMAGSQLNAVVLQYFLSMLLGAGLAASSVVWEIENWSILKRTFVHLVAMSMFMFPIAYVNYWMPHTFLGVFNYFLIFIFLYIIIWAVQYLAWMQKVKAINQKLNDL